MLARSPITTRPLLGVDEPRVFLLGQGKVEATFVFVIRAATSEFATKVTDAPRSTPFSGTLQQPFTFRRTLLDGNSIGVYGTGDGGLDIDNTDANYDFMIGFYAIGGRDITVKALRLGDDYADWFTVFSGTAANWHIDESTVHIVLRDNGYKLNVPAQPNIYLGTGGSEGGDDLAQKRKPRAFGYVSNTAPPVVVPNLLIYQVNDGPVEDVTAAYDRGSPLTQGNDYASYALLAAATTAEGYYDTCLAEGFIKLGSAPAGTVTADISGDKTGGSFVATTAAIVRRIIGTTTTLVDPDDLYVPAFTALDTAQPAPVGYWIGPDDDFKVADCVADLMRGIGGWAAFRRDGRLTVDILVAPAGLPHARFDRTDIIEIKREPPPASLTPPPKRQRVAYARNWTVQTDLANDVSADRKAFAAEQVRLAEASDASIGEDYPYAQDPDPVQSYFRDQADAQDEADRRLVLYGSERALYRITLPHIALARDLGERAEITYPRFDISAGRLGIIVEMTEDAQNRNFEMVVWA